MRRAALADHGYDRLSVTAFLIAEDLATTFYYNGLIGARDSAIPTWPVPGECH